MPNFKIQNKYIWQIKKIGKKIFLENNFFVFYNKITAAQRTVRKIPKVAKLDFSQLLPDPKTLYVAVALL